MQTSPIELQRYLDGVTYPAHRDHLVEVAYDKGASSEVLDDLLNLPAEEYYSPNELMREMQDM